MASHKYAGKIKYIGDNSINQQFKTASLTLLLESQRVYLESRLQCNPHILYKRCEIIGGEVQLKSNRVIIRHTGRGFFELHYIGEPRQNAEKLYNDIQKLLKEAGSKKTTLNKAEVGSEKKSPVLSAELLNVTPKAEKGWQPILQSEAAETDKGPTSETGHLTPSSQESGFTKVKEIKRQSTEAKVSVEECKENQHRGHGNQHLTSKETKTGEQNEPQMSSKSFYGKNDKGLDRRYSPAPSTRPAATPTVRNEVKKGSLAESTPLYSWSKGKTTHTTVAKKDVPRLQFQGFSNLGNTCYMNATLQALLGLDTFSMDLHALCKQKGKSLQKHSLAVAMTRLMLQKQRPQQCTTQKIDELLKNVKLAISASAIRFIGNMQHDAHEFLVQMLDQLKEEVIKVTKPKPCQGKNDDGDDGKQTPPEGASSATHAQAATSSTSDRAVEISTNCGASSYAELSSNQDLVVSKAGKDSPAENLAAVAVNQGGSSPPQQENVTLFTNGSPSDHHLLNPTINNFEFEVVHSFCCVKCQECIQKVEQFNDISVDIPKGNGLPDITLSLQDALDIFFQKEEIEYWCEKCGQSKAMVTHKFAKLPRVLIVHLKRYHQMNNWSKKAEEKIQLPRYITLQDHCDASTVPHKPYSLMQLNSPMSSPACCNSPVVSKSAGSATPEKRQMQARPLNSERSASQKKVRRVLLVDDDGSPPEKRPKKTSSCISLPPDIASSNAELTLKLVKDYTDRDLQKALDLSLQEYQDQQTDRTNNNSDAVSSLPKHTVQDEKEDDIDLSNLSYEKQIEMAIRLSLAEDTKPKVSAGKGSAQDNVDWPSASDDDFKKPDSSAMRSAVEVDGCVSSVDDTPKKQFETAETSTSTHGLAATISSISTGDYVLDAHILSVKSYTMLSDFLRDAEGRSTSPEQLECAANPNSPEKVECAVNTDCSMILEDAKHDSGATDTTSVFKEMECVASTSDMTLEDTDDDPFASETTSVTSVTVSTSIGSLGALSAVSAMDFNMEEEYKGDLAQGHHTPESSPNHAIDDREWNSGRTRMLRPDAKLIPEENKGYSEDVLQDLTDCDPEEFIGPGAMEEKENLSPLKKAKSETDIYCFEEVPLEFDKEAEAKHLQYQLRQTEIEKGVLPHSYRLVSVVSHYGSGTSHGHYASDVFDIKKQAWFSCDDKDVKKTAESFVRSGRTTNGYIFFYLNKEILDDIEATRPAGKELAERP